MSESAVNVYERMARISDAMIELEKIDSLAMMGACSDQHDEDVRNVFAIVAESVRRVRETVDAIVDEVRDATKLPKDTRLDTFVKEVAKVGDKVYGPPKALAKPKKRAKAVK